MITIYLLSGNGRVYVGQTKKPVLVRLATHIQEAFRKEIKRNSTPKAAWIRELVRQDQCPQITILERTNDPSREKHWIDSFAQSYGNNCLNVNHRK